jgi:hypothetical protein
MSKGEQPRGPNSPFKSLFATRRTPRRGDFSFGDFSHAPSPKNLSKNGFCPRKGVAFLRKAFLQKNFYVREKILIE